MIENLALTKLKKIKPGNTLIVLQNYRARGKIGGWQAQAIYAKVVRINRKTIRVRLLTNQRIENVHLDRIIRI